VLDSGARLSSEKLIENGLPPLPHVTPHTMRRTYVSVMLLATNFDVPFVQSQVGHTDSKLTMDVYAQLLDRSKRAHGAAFDALLADAQETLYGAQSGEFSPLFSPPSDFGPPADIAPSSEIGSDTGETDDGRGGFRTCDLSRVNKYPTSSDLARCPCKSVLSRSWPELRRPADLGSIRLGLGQ
jgi:hypothetical protein